MNIRRIRFRAGLSRDQRRLIEDDLITWSPNPSVNDARAMTATVEVEVSVPVGGGQEEIEAAALATIQGWLADRDLSVWWEYPAKGPDWRGDPDGAVSRA